MYCFLPNKSEVVLIEFIKWADAPHYSLLFLNVIDFMKKLGFIAFWTHVFKMGDDEQTDIMMRRPCSISQTLLLSVC